MTQTMKRHYEMKYTLKEISTPERGRGVATALLTWADADAGEYYQEMVIECAGAEDALAQLAKACDEREDVIYGHYNMGREEVRDVVLTLVWR